MLLVHHEQAQVGDRREDGRARSDDDARLAFADAPPLVVALAHGQLAVEHGDRRAEARHRRPHEQRREGDLRQEEDHAPAGGERGLGGPEIHLGLPAAGDAVQDERGIAAASDGVSEDGQDLRLIRSRLGPAGNLALHHAGNPRRPLFFDAKDAGLGQAVDRTPQRGPIADEVAHPGPAARRLQAADDFGLRLAPRREGRARLHGDLHPAETAGRQVLLDRDEPGSPQPGQPRGRVAAQAPRERGDAQRPLPQRLHVGVAGRRVGPQQARHRPARPYSREDQPVALARRRQVVLRHPGRQVEQRRRNEGRLVEDVEDVLQREPFRRASVERGGHDTDHAPRPEGHEDPRAPLGPCEVLRQAVGEAGLDREREGHADRARRHRASLAGTGASRGQITRPAASAPASCPPRLPSSHSGCGAGRPGGRSARP